MTMPKQVIMNPDVGAVEMLAFGRTEKGGGWYSMAGYWPGDDDDGPAPYNEERELWKRIREQVPDHYVRSIACLGVRSDIDPADRHDVFVGCPWRPGYGAALSSLAAWRGHCSMIERIMAELVQAHAPDVEFPGRTRTTLMLLVDTIVMERNVPMAWGWIYGEDLLVVTGPVGSLDQPSWEKPIIEKLVTWQHVAEQRAEIERSESGAEPTDV